MTGVTLHTGLYPQIPPDKSTPAIGYSRVRGRRGTGLGRAAPRSSEKHLFGYTRGGSCGGRDPLIRELRPPYKEVATPLDFKIHARIRLFQGARTTSRRAWARRSSFDRRQHPRLVRRLACPPGPGSCSRRSHTQGTLSNRRYILNSFQRLSSQQNRQLNIFIGNCKQ